MNDNEKDFYPFSDSADDTELTPADDFELSVSESEDIYSNPNMAGEEITPVADMEKNYEGYFKENEEPVFNEYNPYADSAPSASREAPAASFNPYAAPDYSQQFGRSGYSTQNYGYSPYSQQYPQQPVQPPKGGKGKKIAGGLIAACIVIALIAIVSAFFGGSPDTATTDPDASSTQAPTTLKPIMSTTQTNEALSQINSVVIAEKVRPSVVGVMTYKNGQLYGEGSGILWGIDATGTYTYVVTCAHVIDESGVTYGILLLDGKTYEAEMVACDTRTDIGVLRIEATGLPLAEIGDSSALRIGEPIYAIGNPGGAEYFGSITDGIVSAIDRSVSATYTMTCIQHNAAINPGNSGGALVNMAGQIVGINSSKIASTEYEGMGFAVPTTIAVPVVDALIQYKYVPNRPKLGIEYAPVSAYQLYSLVVSIKGLPQGSLVIAGISADSSLKNTQAQVGDLIIGVNGKDMDDSSVLLDLIDTGAVGDTLTLTLCRVESRTYKTTTFDVTITLVEDKGTSQPEEETTTTRPSGNNDYYYGGSGSFEDFFNDYFGFGW